MSLLSFLTRLTSLSSFSSSSSENEVESNVQEISYSLFPQPNKRQVIQNALVRVLVQTSCNSLAKQLQLVTTDYWAILQPSRPRVGELVLTSVILAPDPELESWLQPVATLAPNPELEN